MEAAVNQLQEQVEHYFVSNPGTPPPTLRPRLSEADALVHADTPVRSPRPYVPRFVPKTAPVTRPGSDAGIDKDVMKAALSLVKVDCQTSSVMEDEENMVNAKVANFLEAINKDERVNMLVVIRAKESNGESNGNAVELVNALKNLVRWLPNLLK